LTLTSPFHRHPFLADSRLQCGHLQWISLCEGGLRAAVHEAGTKSVKLIGYCILLALEYMQQCFDNSHKINLLNYMRLLDDLAADLSFYFKLNFDIIIVIEIQAACLVIMI